MIWLGLAPVFVLAATETFTESFTDTAYRDAGETTLTGWGEGALTMQKKDHIVLDTYTTDGNCMDVLVRDNLAYLSEYSNGISILNVSNPSEMKKLGNYTTPSYVSAVDVHGSLAYVALGNGDLEILNVSDPGNIVHVETWNGPSVMLDVVVHGNIACCAQYSGGFRLIDVSDPSSPVDLAGYQPTSADAQGVAVAGNYLYIAVHHAGLDVIDISNPSSPVLVDNLDLGGYANHVALHGDVAFLTCELNGTNLVDISNPMDVNLIMSASEVGARPRGVTVNGEYVYVADSTRGFLTYKIAPNKSLVHVNTDDLAGNQRAVDANGNIVYVASMTAGLHSVQVMEDIALDHVDTFSMEAVPYTHASVIAGHTCFVADGSSGIVAMNISNDIKHPDVMNRKSFGGNAWNLEVDGNILFVADITHLRLLNITDPASMESLSNFSTSQVRSVAVSGDIAYLADYTDGLLIINVSVPASPSHVYTLPTPSLSEDIAIDGKHCYIADGHAGLIAIDVSNPSAPFEMDSADPGGYAYSVEISGDLAFLAMYGGGVAIYNISDPYDLQLAGNYSSPSQDIAWDVTVDGTMAYVSNYTSGLYMLNVSNVATPTLHSSISGNFQAFRITKHGECIYVSNGTGGLAVYEVAVHHSRTHVSSGMARSTVIHELEEGQITGAILNYQLNQGIDGATIDYQLSADNGTNWEFVVPGMEHDFDSTGKALRWQVSISNSNWRFPVEIQSVEITILTPGDRRIPGFLGAGCVILASILFTIVVVHVQVKKKPE